MKIGLLGGSFNPIHNGHIAIAETALNKLSLDEVWFIPTGNHPLKKQVNLLDLEQRIKLITAAIGEHMHFKISLLDADQNSKNYTYDLIRKLKVQNPEVEFYFIIGSDILKELTLWFRYEWLLDNVIFTVFKRPGTKMDPGILHDLFKRLIFINMEPVPVSSTGIRELIKKDQPIKGLVPDIVEAEINKLYKNL